MQSVQTCGAQTTVVEGGALSCNRHMLCTLHRTCYFTGTLQLLTWKVDTWFALYLALATSQALSKLAAVELNSNTAAVGWLAAEAHQNMISCSVNGLPAFALLAISPLRSP